MGVGSSNRKNQWQARILVHGKVTHLGYYETEEDAAKVYDRVSISLHGEAAQTNFPAGEYQGQDSREYSGLDREDLQRALGVKPMDKSSKSAFPPSCSSLSVAPVPHHTLPTPPPAPLHHPPPPTSKVLLFQRGAMSPPPLSWPYPCLGNTQSFGKVACLPVTRTLSITSVSMAITAAALSLPYRAVGHHILPIVLHCSIVL